MGEQSDSDSKSEWSDTPSDDADKQISSRCKKKSKKRHHKHRKSRKKKSHKSKKSSDDDEINEVQEESKVDSSCDAKHKEQINKQDDQKSTDHKSKYDSRSGNCKDSSKHRSRHNSSERESRHRRRRSSTDSYYHYSNRNRHRSRRHSSSSSDDSSRYHKRKDRDYYSRRSRTRSRSPHKTLIHKTNYSNTTERKAADDKESASSKEYLPSNQSDRKKIEIKLVTNLTKQHKPQTVKTDVNKTSLIGEWTTVPQSKQLTTKSNELAKLTDFCKELSKTELQPDNNRTVNSVTGIEGVPAVTTQIHHPFRVEPTPFIPPPMTHMSIQSHNHLKLENIRNAITADVTKTFPVSSGIQHRQSEDKQGTGQATNETVFNQNKKNVDISAVLARRLSAQQKLLANANDISAATEVKLCDLEVQQWSQSHLKPGQFSGASSSLAMDKSHLDEGYKTWARKDMFHSLPPIQGGIGMALLQKMGWSFGQPLGKRKEGFLTPIAIDVKTDRKGLSTSGESKPSSKNRNATDYSGKHPVSALSELCSKQSLGQPSYELVMDHGPSHSKKFLFKVVINGQSYQAQFPSGNKKQAKAEGALAALKAKGFQ